MAFSGFPVSVQMKSWPQTVGLNVNVLLIQGVPPFVLFGPKFQILKQHVLCGLACSTATACSTSVLRVVLALLIVLKQLGNFVNVILLGGLLIWVLEDRPGRKLGLCLSTFVWG